jgi:hypothetical protein
MIIGWFVKLCKLWSATLTSVKIRIPERDALEPDEVAALYSSTANLLPDAPLMTPTEDKMMPLLTSVTLDAVDMEWFYLYSLPSLVTLLISPVPMIPLLAFAKRSPRLALLSIWGIITINAPAAPAQTSLKSSASSIIPPLLDRQSSLDEPFENRSSSLLAVATSAAAVVASSVPSSSSSSSLSSPLPSKSTDGLVLAHNVTTLKVQGYRVSYGHMMQLIRACAHTCMELVLEECPVAWIASMATLPYDYDMMLPLFTLTTLSLPTTCFQPADLSALVAFIHRFPHLRCVKISSETCIGPLRRLLAMIPPSNTISNIHGVATSGPKYETRRFTPCHVMLTD